MIVEKFAKKVREKLETFVEEYDGCDEELGTWLELFEDWIENE